MMRVALSAVALLVSATTSNAISVTPESRAAASVEWTTHARRFTGESWKVRDSAIQSLKKDKKLPEKLKQAFGTTDHFLALDVITTLKLHSLLSFILASSDRDKTGYSYHTVNAIMWASDKKEVVATYLERLDRKNTAPAAKMTILDSLSRMNVEIPLDMSKRILESEEPEVRSALLSLVRAAALTRAQYENLSLLSDFMKDEAFQIRMQTIFLVSEIPETVRAREASLFQEIFARCEKDPVAQVKAVCLSVKSEEKK